MAISFIEKLKDLISPRNEKGQQPYQEASQKASIKDAYQNVNTNIKESQMNFIILIKTISTAVKEIENLMPDSSGKDKLDAAIALVESLLGSVTPLLPMIESLIAFAVNTFNTLGLFKKKTA